MRQRFHSISTSYGKQYLLRECDVAPGEFCGRNHFYNFDPEDSDILEALIDREKQRRASWSEMVEHPLYETFFGQVEDTPDEGADV